MALADHTGRTMSTGGTREQDLRDEMYRGSVEDMVAEVVDTNHQPFDIFVVAFSRVFGVLALLSENIETCQRATDKRCC